MIENLSLPEALNMAIGSDSKDFAVIGLHSKPLKKSIGTIISGLVVLAFMSIFVILFLGPLFVGEEVHFTANGVPKVAGPGNLGPIAAPAIIIGVLVFVGFCILTYGIFSLFKKGGYFVGTKTRLINYKKGKIVSTDWEQFTGNIEVYGNEKRGTISMEMRTGYMVSRKNGSQYVPNVVYISGIPDVFEIEQLCRKRIKENDPTPALA